MSLEAKHKVWNLPNILSILRIAIIPLILVFLHYENRFNCFIAACLFSVASITDYLDGYLARKTGQITVLGKFLDPLADKLIVASTLIMLIPQGRISAWVVVLILARELIITGLRGIASSEGLVIAAGQGGKWKTAFQLTGILALIIHYPYPVAVITPGIYELVAGTEFHRVLASWGVQVRPWVDFNVVGLWLIYLSLLFSIVSAVQYIAVFVRSLGKKT